MTRATKTRIRWNPPRNFHEGHQVRGVGAPSQGRPGLARAQEERPVRPLPRDFVAGAWVNVCPVDGDEDLPDPARVMSGGGDDTLEVRFPGEPFSRVYLQEPDGTFVEVRDGPPHTTYGPPKKLALHKAAEQAPKSREEMEKDLAWADLDWSALTDEQLKNVHRWCEARHELGSCTKPVWSEVKKERRYGRTNRQGWRWVLYTYVGSADTEREQGVYFRRRDAKQAARRYEALRWADETDPRYGHLVYPFRRSP